MTRTVLTVLALCLAVAPAAMAEESCQNSGHMMSAAAMRQSLEQRGYTKIRSLSSHNGCYEAKGFDKNGRRFEVELNGATGAIQNAE